MFIKINNSDNIEEWFLLEFKGHFEAPDNSESLKGCKIGEITWLSDTRCDLRMGQKSLTGEVKKLKEWFQVTRKHDDRLEVIAIVKNELQFLVEPRLELFNS